MKLLEIPNKLYGRDWKITMLSESYEHNSSGHSQILLVSGSSNVRKTALVQKLQMPI